VTSDEIHQLIEMTPFRGREPVFRVTNVEVRHIINDFADGMKEAETPKEHPQLSEKHIQATFVFFRVALDENDPARLYIAFGGLI
jgi:uncharacterized protein (DUF433 family)